MIEGEEYLDKDISFCKFCEEKKETEEIDNDMLIMSVRKRDRMIKGGREEREEKVRQTVTSCCFNFDFEKEIVSDKKETYKI